MENDPYAKSFRKADSHHGEDEGFNPEQIPKQRRSRQLRLKQSQQSLKSDSKIEDYQTKPPKTEEEISLHS